MAQLHWTKHLTKMNLWWMGSYKLPTDDSQTLRIYAWCYTTYRRSIHVSSKDEPRTQGTTNVDPRSDGLMTEPGRMVNVENQWRYTTYRGLIHLYSKDKPRTQGTTNDDPWSDGRTTEPGRVVNFSNKIMSNSKRPTTMRDSLNLKNHDKLWTKQTFTNKNEKLNGKDDKYLD